MQLNFDINRSLKANPLKKQHGHGVIYEDDSGELGRQSLKLKTLVVKDSKGNSLQPREKDIEENRAEGETLSFKQLGILYDKDTMVAELREDGQLELISGYNRREYLIENYGEEVVYFADVVKFETPFYKTLWKRRYNSGKDHSSQGVPNTVGSYVKGLIEGKNNNEFDDKDDDAVRGAIDFMARGKKSSNQIESILNKFRETNSKEIGIKALNSEMANKEARKLKLPIKGYQKNIKHNPKMETGYVKGGGNFLTKIAAYIDLIDNYNQPVKITGFILFAEHDNIQKQRKKFIDDFNESLLWLRNHGLGHYADKILFQGFLAQITTKDKSQGGGPKERGLVDVDGKIIKE